MADAPTNKATSDAAIVAQYPEIPGLEAVLDSYAAEGRQEWTTLLITAEHAKPVKTALETLLVGKSYTISVSAKTVKVTWC